MPRSRRDDARDARGRDDDDDDDERFRSVDRDDDPGRSRDRESLERERTDGNTNVCELDRDRYGIVARTSAMDDGELDARARVRH